MKNLSTVVELLKKLIAHLIVYVPSFRKRFWSQFYEFVSQTIDHDDFLYMNLGYADLDGEEDKIHPESPDELHHFSNQLYQHVAGSVDLRDREVLEIGCGRGGGSAYVAERLKPKRLVATDLSPRAVEFCKRRHNLSGLFFEVVDAESLPFGDESFDAAISIESSHCYSAKVRFLTEVARVLRPRGYFLYADNLNPLFDPTSIEKLHGLFNHCGLRLLKAENITRNVFRSRQILSNSSLYRNAIARWSRSHGIRSKLMSSIFCLEGTPSYERLRTGELQYWSWVLEKAGSFNRD